MSMTDLIPGGAVLELAGLLGLNLIDTVDTSDLILQPDDLPADQATEMPYDGQFTERQERLYVSRRPL